MTCQKTLNRRTIYTTIAFLLSSALWQPSPAHNKSNPRGASEEAIVCKRKDLGEHRRVSASILIHARVDTVWNTVHIERQKDPDIAYAKILEHEANKMILEEKFVLLPVVGTAVCLMKDTEIPNQRIDYHLIKSDRFKALEGSWVLTSVDNGHSTILELSSYLELGFPVPRPLLDGITAQKLERRIRAIKNQAEKAEASVAAK